MTDDSAAPHRTTFDPERIIEALSAHGVRYVVIGAVAATAHGAPIGATFDVDVTPARDPLNLERLSDALGELSARIRTDAVEGGLPFSHDAASLATMQTLNLTCPYGDSDLAFAPSGTNGYDDLVRGSESITIGTVEVQVAALDDVIRSKEAAGRRRTSLCRDDVGRFGGRGAWRPWTAAPASASDRRFVAVDLPASTRRWRGSFHQLPTFRS